MDLEKEKDRFRRDILPALRVLPLGRIMKATVYFRWNASLARRGLYLPHPVRYERLSMLIHAMG
jgi:hypothetical protein